MERIPFLKPSILSIKKSIRGIDESYNNYWDILAELIQNSVDAIKKKDDQSGKIEIEINSLKNEIRVKDNGVGIILEEIPILLSPFSTNKEDDMETIGEKGVGLKFVIFQSNDFKMITTSSSSKETAFVKISGAKTWKEGDSVEEFCLDLDKIDDSDNEGTDITIKGVENDELFKLDFQSIKFILRTRTAIGNTLSLFDEDEEKKIKVTLTLIDYNGKKTTEEIKYKYWLPTENIKINNKINFEDYKKWTEESDKGDIEKKNKLKDKIVYRTGTIMHNGYREIKYWSCFAPRRRVYDDISVNDKLITEEILNDDNLKQQKIFSTHQAGIYTSVKGMPTGITIDTPVTGVSGYWPHIMIIFEDKLLKFDIGRKSINGNIKNIYKEHAKILFSDYVNYIAKYTGGDPETNNNPIWDRDNIKNEIDNMPLLNNDIINFKHLPTDQEASVAAIFYELIGAHYITEIEPAISGYRDRYDLYAYWNNHFISIEFKSHLRNIVRDFDDAVKYSNEIDYIVCWDINDEDIKSLHKKALFVEEIDNDSIFSSNSEVYLPETTHKITVAVSSKPIYVIDLKILTNKIKNKKE